MHSIWDQVYWGNSVRNWAIAVGIIVVASIIARLLKRVVHIRLKEIAARTTSPSDDFFVMLLDRNIMPLLYLVAFYAGIRFLYIDAAIFRILHAAFIIIVVYFAIRAISDLFSFIFQRYASRRGDQYKQARGVLLIIKCILWLGGAVFILDNLGYNITTIVTGLGIGGIAIALAAQAVLGDLFSYLVIFFDKPFEIGDFIVAGEQSGVVEYIGIKTTRLRTLGGEQLIMSNTDLTNSRVQNYKRMDQRRVLLNVGVGYDTSAEKLRVIPGMIQGIIESQGDVKFDRAHFTGFGNFSLNFEVVYFILNADYLKFMNSQQDFFLQLIDRFTKEDIQFAYPTQRLLFANAAAPGTGPAAMMPPQGTAPEKP